MRYRDTSPYELRVKYPCTCAETGKALKKGDEAVYYPASKKMFCMDSKQAESFRSAKFDEQYLGYQY